MRAGSYTDRPAPGAAARIVRSGTASLVDKEVCILVTYCPTGKPGYGLEFLAGAFAKQGIEIVLCLIVDTECTQISPEQLPNCSTVLTRMNAGHDFGAWAGVLRAVPELWHAKRIFFVNDSVVGPNESFSDLIEVIRRSDADFVALTASHIHCYHAQSYFFVYGTRALRNRNIQSAWLELPDYTSKQEVIRNCEQAQLGLFAELELRTKIVFSLHDVISQATEQEVNKWSPTHHLWRELCLRGFPFLKVDLFHRPKWKTGGWTQFFSGEAAEAIRIQVRESIEARNSTRHPSRTSGHKLKTARPKQFFRRFGKLLLAEWRLRRG